VHRDVKPSNVLVDERGHCYLDRLVATVRVTGSPTDVSVGAGSVWTAGDAS
jgi:serine/threonine protein kinase